MVSRLVLWLVIATTFLLGQSQPIWAHGGEDHGAQQAQAPVLPIGATNVKLVKTSALEILIKYPTPKFGVETPLRIFITDLKTNAPISGVNATVIINALNQANIAGATSATSSTVNAIPTDKAGIYEAKLIFPDKGQYSITLKLTGTNIDAQTMIPGVVVPDATISDAGNLNVKSWRNLPKIYFILPIIFVITIVLGVMLWQRSRQLSKSRQSSSEHIA